MDRSSQAVSAADRLAVVTGTSSGIGTATAQRLLDQGWHVVGIARRPAPIDHPDYRHLELDLGDLAAVIGVCREQLGPLLGNSGWRRIGLVNNAAAIGSLGPAEGLDPDSLLDTYRVNTAAPIYLMGAVIRHAHRSAVIRIVNVSTGAAVHPIPGLAAYGTSKAALRLAGMVLAAELEAGVPNQPRRGDVAILSYEPGVVDTEMQVSARSRAAEDFPWVGRFQGYWDQGMLVPPDRPAGDIVSFLDADDQPWFAERRLGG